MAKKKNENKEKAPQKRWGDRRDGTLIRDLDSLHIITGILYPNRCDNEAYIPLTIEMEPILSYIEKKNAIPHEMKYTFFHVIVVAMMKTLHLRPAMNRFIANCNFYQHNDVSAGFVVKKQFADGGKEALAKLVAEKTDTMDTLHEKLSQVILAGRSESRDKSSESMDIVSSLPRFLVKFVCRLSMFLEKRGKAPKSFVASDPYYTSFVISNVGSFGLPGGYHHLTNWGTCSLIALIGEKKRSPFYREDGSVEMKETINIGITIDERIADGYYYAKSMKLLAYLLAHPETLDQPMEAEVDYE